MAVRHRLCVRQQTSSSVKSRPTQCTMAQPDRIRFRQVFPTRAMAVLLGIGLIDLIATAVLHAQGLVTELNPLMKPFINESEWLFALVKGSTLLAAWSVMRRYCPENLAFVRNASILGSVAYVVLWTSWFFGAGLHN